MSISVAEHGTTPDGRAVRAYTLANDAGVSLTVLDYGSTLISVKCPRGDGAPAEEITLCRPSLAELTDRSLNPYFGSTVGRVANRIAGARFDLDGATHTLAANFAGHCIHGGVKGWDQVVWRTVDMGLRSGGSDCFVTLRHCSPAGDEGFPGAVTATATYSLSRDSIIGMAFTADVAGSSTPVNICNHAYWTLGGVGRTVHDTELTVFAPLVVDVDETTQIPTGKLLPVTDEVAPGAAAFDFRSPKPIGRHLGCVTGGGCSGYDHSFVLPHAVGAASVEVSGASSLPVVDVPADLTAAARDLERRVDAWRRPALGASAHVATDASAAAAGGAASAAAAAPKRSWLDDLLASDDDASGSVVADDEAAKHPALRWDAAFSTFTADTKPATAGSAAATTDTSAPHITVSPAAVVHDPGSGRRMTVFTSQPCVHVYTTNMLLGQAPPFTPHSAVCLETQHPPDAINQPLCGSVVVRPGGRYEHVTFHKLEWAAGVGTPAAAATADTAATAAVAHAAAPASL